MAFPLYYLLLPVALFGLVYVIFVLLDLYHLVSFADLHLCSFVVTFIFLAGVVYITFWAWTLAAPLNWQESLNIFNNVTFSAPTF
ncbi:MAG TPA: hypothetical protein PKY08_02045 [Candidatus Magasanikbacteria bacterium]|nr:hypothetical protein [Candidatus Magasanikbacteria bacterium]